jgi:PAS domain S-box-containing protein
VAADTAFHTFLELSTDPIVIHRQGHVVFANAAASRALGFEAPESPVGQPLESFVPPAARALVAERIRTMTEERRPVPRIEEQFIRRDGGTITVDVLAFPMLLDGELSVLVAGRDESARKNAEADRERLLHKIDRQRVVLETIVQHAPIAIALMTGPEFVIEIANPTMEAFAPGIPLIGRQFREFAQAVPEALRLLEKVRATGETVQIRDMPLEIQRAPGATPETAWFNIALVAIRDDGAPAESVLHLASETTEHVRSNRIIQQLATEAQQRSSQLRGILDTIVDAVFVCDAGGVVSDMNHAARALLGQKVGETTLRTIQDVARALNRRLLSGTLTERHELPLARALVGETVASADEAVIEPDSGRELFMRSSAAPIHDGHGTVIGAVEVVRDVTQRVELDRVEGFFLRTAAHELKTPVAVVKGYVQALVRRWQRIPEEERRLLASIERGADRMDRIVSDLLYVSQIDLDRLHVARESVDLVEIARSAVAIAARRESGRSIRIDGDRSVRTVADRDLIEQALLRLLDNAIRFSPRETEVEVTVRLDGNEAIASVRDRGVGIAKERQPDVFKRFHRVHAGVPSDEGGLGVGLYISRAIAERHGGTIRFESAVGAGSTFHLVLPAATE